jgi:hypothetical protein
MERQSVQQIDGGSSPTPSLQFYELKIIDAETAFNFVRQHHYSRVRPRLTKICIGGYKHGELRAVMTLGWGVRPLHTIRKLFPSLTTRDYFEIGKLCLMDVEPKNSESRFIAQVLKWVRQNCPDIKLIFTWADAMWGKPGYVYQASNFLYGGFIWTDVYLNERNERVHPRQLRAAREKVGMKNGSMRPSAKELAQFGWKHFFGKQFRYVYFLCDKQETTRLLKETSVSWSRNYPKHTDLEWKISTGQGRLNKCLQPQFIKAFDCEESHGAQI